MLLRTTEMVSSETVDAEVESYRSIACPYCSVGSLRALNSVTHSVCAPPLIRECVGHTDAFDSVEAVASIDEVDDNHHHSATEQFLLLRKLCTCEGACYVGDERRANCSRRCTL